MVKRKKGKRQQHMIASRNRRSYNVYDTSHVWHIDAANQDITAGKWRRAECGYLFQAHRRDSKTYPICKSCTQALEQSFAPKERHQLRELFKKASREVDRVLNKRPKRLVEQRYEPPEGIVEHA